VCENNAIRAGDLSLVASPIPEVDSTDLEVLERRTIERVMRDADWNKVKASRRLGITRTQLYQRLRKYGLENPATPSVDANPFASHGIGRTAFSRQRRSRGRTPAAYLRQ